jgi:hypothetical protein
MQNETRAQRHPLFFRCCLVRLLIPHATAAAALLVALGCAPSLHADLFNTNLVLNGDAEAGPGDPNGNQVPYIPNWTTNNGTFTVVQYQASSGSYPALTDPGPADRGTNCFAGGPNSALSSAYQNIDVSTAAARIDAGQAVCLLSGWLGGWDGQDDNAMMVAAFLNAAATTQFGSLTNGPVLSVDRGGATALLYRQAAAVVPAGTRLIQLQLIMTRVDGNYNDGYADNLSLVLVSPPTLAAAQSSGAVTLSWPTNVPIWHLESSASLTTAWTNPAIVPNTLGTNFIATLPATNSQQFYRLQFP